MSDKAEADSYPHVAVFGVEGAALRATICIDPPGMLDRPVGVGRCERSFPVLPSCRFSKLHGNKKNHHPSSQIKGPISLGPTLLAITRTQKISTRTTHTAAEKLLAGSTSTTSNVQSNTTVQPVRAASGATVQV
jgi:hypothetical protein